MIKSPLAFVIYTRLKGVDRQLKAGEYRLSKSSSLPEITRQLVSGPLQRQVVTIPEGFTVQQIAELLNRQGLVNADKFLQEVEQGEFNYPFLAGLPEGPRRLEGYLFPDTYCFSSNTSAHGLVDSMLQNFYEKITSWNYIEQAQRAGLTLHEALTIASMIEKEARVNTEQPIIAGVIRNRLRLGMPLQIDATVQYALGSHRAKLYNKDLEVNSPYNTYKIIGLPPGPIACPGEQSLLAAVRPAQTNYLYYVAKPDGTHVFATTLAEHNANKKKYQR